MKRSSSPSSRRSATAPDLVLHPSPWLRRVVLAAHLAALAVPLLLPWPPSVRLLLALVLLASAWRALRPTPWTRLVATGDDGWQLHDRAGTVHEACWHGGGVRHPWLVTLPLRLADGRRCLVTVCADAVPAGGHAALRRWLLSADGR